MQVRRSGIICLSIAFVFPAFTAADEAVSADSAIVQVVGPKPGKMGKRDLDIAGREYSDEASFAVVEFRTADLGLGRVRGVSSLTVNLTHTVQPHSMPGMLRICIFLNNEISLSANDPEIFFDLNEMMGLGVQGSGGYPRYEMDDLEYMPGDTGDVDMFTFDIPAGSHIEKLLTKLINTGGVIRICVCPMEMDGMEDVMATYAGFAHPNEPYRPTLTVVPRP